MQSDLRSLKAAIPPDYPSPHDSQDARFLLRTSWGQPTSQDALGGRLLLSITQGEVTQETKILRGKFAGTIRQNARGAVWRVRVRVQPRRKNARLRKDLPYLRGTEEPLRRTLFGWNRNYPTIVELDSRLSLRALRLIWQRLPLPAFLRPMVLDWSSGRPLGTTSRWEAHGRAEGRALALVLSRRVRSEADKEDTNKIADRGDAVDAEEKAIRRCARTSTDRAATFRDWESYTTPYPVRFRDKTSSTFYRYWIRRWDGLTKRQREKLMNES